MKASELYLDKVRFFLVTSNVTTNNGVIYSRTNCPGKVPFFPQFIIPHPKTKLWKFAKHLNRCQTLEDIDYPTDRESGRKANIQMDMIFANMRLLYGNVILLPHLDEHFVET
jgi:hypothetical protein